MVDISHRIVAKYLSAAKPLTPEQKDAARKYLISIKSQYAYGSNPVYTQGFQPLRAVKVWVEEAWRQVDRDAVVDPKVQWDKGAEVMASLRGVLPAYKEWVRSLGDLGQGLKALDPNQQLVTRAKLAEAKSALAPSRGSWIRSLGIGCICRSSRSLGCW